MRRLSILALLLCACAGAPPSASPAPPPSAASAAPAAPPAPRYLAVFDELVKRIERDHVFPPRYARDVGHPWRDDVPALRDEFARATDRREALVALRHLQNSLRDGHCRIQPPSDLSQRTLTLGLGLWAGGTAAAPEVHVEKVLDPDARAAISPGDTIVAVDGVPLVAWLAAHPFESVRLAPDIRVAESLSFIASV